MRASHYCLLFPLTLYPLLPGPPSSYTKSSAFSALLRSAGTAGTTFNVQFAVRHAHVHACEAPLSESHDCHVQALRIGRVLPVLRVEDGGAQEVVWVLVQDPGGYGDEGRAVSRVRRTKAWRRI